ncbi:ABC transporter ATP-binding protein [Carnobacteriaceae bacterium zg-ZUI78]|nr:ABC transporter ATP-binding protein [Carnobacteriaceae bacterium zg-ZUI78]
MFYKTSQKFQKVTKIQVLTLLFILIRTALNLLLVVNIQKIIDYIAEKKHTQLNETLIHITIILGFYGIVLFIAQYFLRQLFYIGKLSIIENLYQLTINKPISFFQKYSHRHLVSNITIDSNKISDWYSQGIIIFLTQVIILVTTLCLMSFYHGIITVIIFTTILTCFFIVKMITKKIARLTSDSQHLFADIHKAISESFDGIFYIKQLQKENYFTNYMSHKLTKQKYINQKIAVYFSLYVSISSFVAFVLPMISLLLSVLFILNSQMTLGAAIAMYSLTRLLHEPIRVIADKLNERDIALQTQKNLHHIYSPTPKISYQSLPELKTLNIAIQSFNYNNKSILCDVFFSLNRGDVLIIKGKVGSVKQHLVISS